MDLTSIVTLASTIIGGGPHAIIVILILIIIALLFDRSRLVKEVENKDTRLTKIIDDYYEGNLTLAGALDSLKTVLYEIKAKF